MIDLNSLSDQELEAISKGDLNSLSDSTLEMIANSGASQQPAQENQSDSLGKVASDIGVGGVSGLFSKVNEGDAPGLVAMGIDSLLQNVPSTVLQYPQQFGLGGPVGANVARGANTIAGLLGKDKTFEESNIVPQTETPRGSLQSLLVGAGGQSLGQQFPDLAKKSIMGLGRAGGGIIDKLLDAPKPESIKVLQSSADDVTKEISNLQEFMGSEKARVDRLEGTAKTFLQDAHAAADNEALLTKTKYAENIGELDGVLRNKAVDVARKVRDASIPYSREIGQSYANKYLPMIEGKGTSNQNIFNALGEVVRKNDLQVKQQYGTLSKAESAFLDFVSKFDQKGNYALVDLDREMTNLLKPYMGKQYTAGEHLLTDARKAVGDILADQIPELKVLKAEFAPKFQLRNAIFQRTRPFDKTGDAAKSIDTFANTWANAATGNLNKRLNEFDTLAQIRKEIPLKEMDELFNTGGEISRLKTESLTIDEMLKQSKMNQAKEVDAFLGRQKSDLINEVSRKSEAVSIKEGELKQYSSELESLMKRKDFAQATKRNAAIGALSTAGLAGASGLVYKILNRR